MRLKFLAAILAGVLVPALAQGQGQNFPSPPPVVGPPASQFTSDAYTQATFVNTQQIFSCKNLLFANLTCFRIVNEFSSNNGLPTSFNVDSMYTGSGTLANLVGIGSDARTLSTGVVTILDAMAGTVHVGGAGTAITNARSYHAYPCDNVLGGTITNCAGIYVDSQTVGTGTNYSIFTNLGTASFADNTQLFQLTPATSAGGGTNFNSPVLSEIATCWNGSASVGDFWSIQNALVGTANPTSILNFTHSGCTAAGLVHFAAPVRGKYVLGDQGTACTNGELALSAGWQSTGSATVTAVAGAGQTCSWTITTGTTTAASPTVTDTLTNVLPTATTVCEMNIHGGTHTAAAGEGFNMTTPSATAPIFTFNGTPTAGGTTYFVTRSCGP